MGNKIYTIQEILPVISHEDGTEYYIMINGQEAVNAAKKIIGNRCYVPIFENAFIGQLEIVIDEPGEYNGKPQKWVSFAYISHTDIEKAFTWLQENGFSNMFATIRQEDPQTSDYIPDFPEFPFVIPAYDKSIDNEYIELPKNKLVVFNDKGKKHKADYCSVRYCSRFHIYKVVAFEHDNNGIPYFIYSNEIIDKPTRQKKERFVPSKDNCSVRIIPSFETEKAYAIEDGSNGLYGKSCKVYYKYIAKSICYIDKNGNIFAPVFAIK